MDYSLRPQLKPEPVAATAPTSKGLGTPTSKPAEPLQEDWYARFTRSFTEAGGTLADTPFTDTNPASLYERSEMTLADFDEMTRRSAEVAALNRMEAGITASLVEPARLKRLKEDESLVPELRPEPEFVDAEDADVPIEPPVDVTEEELEATPVKAEGKGLMSKPATEEEATVDTDIFANIITAKGSTSVDSATPLTSGFDSLVEAEGTDIHLDGRGFVTLPYGIVPDKGSVKKSDGTTFDPTGSHGLSPSQLSGVDYSGATKYGISRTDYDSDEAFAKAVYAEFANRTASSYGDGFAGLTDGAKQAAYDMAWNAGIGSADWSSVKTMLKEASSEGVKDKDKLIGFTTNFRSDTDYPRGLLKRRLQTYNLVANQGEEASVVTTEAVSTKGVRTGTRYTIKAADGTVLKVWEKPDTNEVLGDLEVPQ